MISTDQLDEIYTVLKNLNPGYSSRTLVMREANRILTMPLTEAAWRRLWNSNRTISDLFNQLLKPQARRYWPDVETVPQPQQQYLPVPFQPSLNWQVGDDAEQVDTYNPIITGVTAADQLPDPDEVFQKMCDIYDRESQTQERKRNQVISFNDGPVCLVNIADTHFGDKGVDGKRVFYELDIVRNTPGMYINFLGDMTNNFIGAWTRKINHDKPMSIEEEIALSIRYIKMAIPKLIAFCAGNHDNWTKHEAGIDMMKHLLNEFGANAIYDMHENVFTLNVKGEPYTVRARHKWDGGSQWNDTHAIEKLAKMDHAIPFDIGVGAHTHRSGLYREFNNGGKTGVAVLCGAYKRYDDYAREIGAPIANKSTAVCVILDPNSIAGMYGVSDIESAAKIMKALRR